MEFDFAGDPEAIEDIDIARGVKGRLLVARGKKMRWEIEMTAASSYRAAQKKARVLS